VLCCGQAATPPGAAIPVQGRPATGGHCRIGAGPAGRRGSLDPGWMKGPAEQRRPAAGDHRSLNLISSLPSSPALKSHRHGLPGGRHSPGSCSRLQPGRTRARGRRPDPRRKGRRRPALGPAPHGPLAVGARTRRRTAHPAATGRRGSLPHRSRAGRPPGVAGAGANEVAGGAGVAGRRGSWEQGEPRRSRGGRPPWVIGAGGQVLPEWDTAGLLTPEQGRPE